MAPPKLLPEDPRARRRSRQRLQEVCADRRLSATAGIFNQVTAPTCAPHGIIVRAMHRFRNGVDMAAVKMMKLLT
jgi:hypothetical protein